MARVSKRGWGHSRNVNGEVTNEGAGGEATPWCPGLPPLMNVSEKEMPNRKKTFVKERAYPQQVPRLMWHLDSQTGTLKAQSWVPTPQPQSANGPPLPSVHWTPLQTCQILADEGREITAQTDRWREKEWEKAKRMKYSKAKMGSFLPIMGSFLPRKGYLQILFYPQYYSAEYPVSQVYSILKSNTEVDFTEVK